jgi:hypothetical protein
VTRVDEMGIQTDSFRCKKESLSEQCCFCTARINERTICCVGFETRTARPKASPVDPAREGCTCRSSWMRFDVRLPRIRKSEMTPRRAGALAEMYGAAKHKRVKLSVNTAIASMALCG